ncbi:MAG: hypothetical protein GXP05_03980 [Alphaproteobacteria bacterium]|nr:hypothetical protein [Alphaproteobacteria bacterium]
MRKTFQSFHPAVFAGESSLQSVKSHKATNRIQRRHGALKRTLQLVTHILIDVVGLQVRPGQHRIKVEEGTESTSNDKGKT